jgi:hypothetical protein
VTTSFAFCGEFFFPQVLRGVLRADLDQSVLTASGPSCQDCGRMRMKAASFLMQFNSDLGHVLFLVYVYSSHVPTSGVGCEPETMTTRATQKIP